jgi:hypothetical protein
MILGRSLPTFYTSMLLAPFGFVCTPVCATFLPCLRLPERDLAPYPIFRRRPQRVGCVDCLPEYCAYFLESLRR